jgi:hypothetical protein
MSHSDAQRSGASYLKWWLIGGLVLIAGAVGAYLFWPNADETVVVATDAPPEPPKPRTVPEMLSESVKADIEAAGSQDITFTDVRIVDGVPFDYPAGTKVVYLRLGVERRALGLLEQADVIGGKFFERAFKVSPDVAAVYIDVVGPVVDRYGHSQPAPWITFVMNRRTYDKIDWTGFDKGSLCEFLSHEHVFDNESGSFCGTKGEL